MVQHLKELWYLASMHTHSHIWDNFRPPVYLFIKNSQFSACMGIGLTTYLWMRTWKNCGALCVCIPTHWYETIPIPSICVFVKNSQCGYRVDTPFKPLMAKTDLGSWPHTVLHNVDITNLYNTRQSVFWYVYWFQSAAEWFAQCHHC